ncbi:uncharacterized protein OCT59_001506 [Rhizophagus irregularis]|uniref:uncharacterized protein n=1 Tax=Rhizophagus irregularis TaxID=588596 RepID=UPI003316FEFE|nr:hypothetical protein OCT59_001506 [Rhizophagus irregularis]
MLTSSFYIHLRAENLLYRKNQRSGKLDHWMRRLLDRPQFSLSNEYNFIHVAYIQIKVGITLESKDHSN